MVLDHGSKSFIADDFVEFCSNGSLMGTYIIVGINSSSVDGVWEMLHNDLDGDGDGKNLPHIDAELFPVAELSVTLGFAYALPQICFTFLYPGYIMCFFS
jgi:hypothetical protein